MDWADFWDQAHCIYVNRRHLDVHYRDIADQMLGLLPKGEPRVLDYGCGEAIYSGHIADFTTELVLCDAAPSVRSRLVGRFAGNRKIRVLAPEEVNQLPAQSFDFVCINSVVQYVPPDRLAGLLGAWRRLLAPDAVLLIADVIPPHVGPLRDVVALLRYAATNRFLTAAMVGCVRTAFSSYRQVRKAVGLSIFTEAEFLQILAANGLLAARQRFNLGHNQARMTFCARSGPQLGDFEQSRG